MAGVQLGDKTWADDNATIEKTTEDGTEWLHCNRNTSIGEIAAKMKDVGVRGSRLL